MQPGPDIPPPSVPRPTEGAAAQRPSGADRLLTAWLRDNSNFITPRAGLFSNDTWTALAIMIRNISVIWLTVLPYLFLVVLAVKVLAGYLDGIADPSLVGPIQSRPIPPPFLQFILYAPVYAPVMVLGFAVHIVTLGWAMYRRLNLRAGRLSGTPSPKWELPLLGVGLIFGFCCYLIDLAQTVFPQNARLPVAATDHLGAFAHGPLLGMLGAATGWFVGLIFTWRRAELRRHELSWKQQVVDLLIWTFFAGGLLGLLATVGALVVRALPDLTILDLAPCDEIWVRLPQGTALVIFGVSWLALAQLLAEALYLGISSAVMRRATLLQRDAAEVEREWLARYGGWQLRIATIWLVLASTVLVAPALFGSCAEFYLTKAIAALGGVTGLITLALGWKRVTEATNMASTRAGLSANVVLAIVAPIFAIVLLCGVTLLEQGLHTGLDRIINDPTPMAGHDVTVSLRYWSLVSLAELALIGLAIVATHRIDINRFSLHGLYRNRLQRAFLGARHYAATNGWRQAEPETGLSPADNIRLHELEASRAPGGRERRLFHVINATLNTLGSSRLSWQERKAAPFTMTPLHCGSSLIWPKRVAPKDFERRHPNFRTDTLGVYRASHSYGGPDGVSLATAMAISGAAASPNMGYHSSPGITFLMAMFNIRLGWWLGNPMFGDYSVASPKNGAWAFAMEAFGLTSEKRNYVCLTDGGHFENLAIYEMVLRRVRFMVVSDVGCDGSDAYTDLGNAVRKIAIDLGIRISFPETPLTSESGELTTCPYAIGYIHYAEALGDGHDDPKKDGLFLYIKPSMALGGEPVSVQSYRKLHPQFPHESTGDQWFSELQFESYRQLGFHIADTALWQARHGIEGQQATLKVLLTNLLEQQQERGLDKPPRFS